MMERTTNLMAGLLASTLLISAANADTNRFWTMEVQPERMAVQQEMADGFAAATGHTVEIIPVEDPTSRRGPRRPLQRATCLMY